MSKTATVVALGKGERTAARIREVALDQFSRLGFERVTLSGIAEAAEVSQPTLHYHFRDKDHLWRSAMLELAAVIRDEERLLKAARDAAPLTQLRMAMRMFLEVSWRHPALGRIIALEGMAGGERLAWLNENLTGARNRRLAELARRAMAAGELKPFPPELLVVTVQAAAVGAVNLAPLLRSEFGYEPDTPEGRAAHEELILNALMQGLVADRSGRDAEEAP